MTNKTNTIDPNAISIDEMVEKIVGYEGASPDKLWVLVHMIDLEAVVKSMEKTAKSNHIKKLMGVEISPDLCMELSYAIIKAVRPSLLKRQYNHEE